MRRHGHPARSAAGSGLPIALAAAVVLGLLSISAAACSGAGSGAPSSTPASPTPTPSPTPEGPSARSYVVKQTVTLGHETISGSVCNIRKPFTVTSVAPSVTFAFMFVPSEALKGSFSYAYSIPSAGESHSATGTYTITESTSGVLTVSLAGSDHVAFKGFDGPFPFRYRFDLVPTGPAAC